LLTFVFALLSLNCNPPISASHIAGIIGMNHHTWPSL
jgi:hypothetical protein